MIHSVDCDTSSNTYTVSGPCVHWLRDRSLALPWSWFYLCTQTQHYSLVFITTVNSDIAFLLLGLCCSIYQDTSLCPHPDVWPLHAGSTHPSTGGTVCSFLELEARGFEQLRNLESDSMFFCASANVSTDVQLRSTHGRQC